MISPQGRMLTVSSCQKGTRGPVDQKLPGLERPTFWALVSQAVSRQRPKFGPGSISDPMTYSKGVPGRGQVVLVLVLAPHLLPTWEMDRLIVPRQKQRGEALSIPSAKPSRNQGAFICHTLSSVQLRSLGFPLG